MLRKSEQSFDSSFGWSSLHPHLAHFLEHPERVGLEDDLNLFQKLRQRKWGTWGEEERTWGQLDAGREGIPAAGKGRGCAPWELPASQSPVTRGHGTITQRLQTHNYPEYTPHPLLKHIHCACMWPHKLQHAVPTTHTRRTQGPTEHTETYGRAPNETPGCCTAGRTSCSLHTALTHVHSEHADDAEGPPHSTPTRNTTDPRHGRSAGPSPTHFTPVGYDWLSVCLSKPTLPLPPQPASLLGWCQLPDFPSLRPIIHRLLDFLPPKRPCLLSPAHPGSICAPQPGSRPARKPIPPGLLAGEGPQRELCPAAQW